MDFYRYVLSVVVFVFLFKGFLLKRFVLWDLLGKEWKTPERKEITRFIEKPWEVFPFFCGFYGLLGKENRKKIIISE